MLEFKYISIAISFLCGAYIINKIRRFDVYEKEPLIKMALATVYGGIVSIILAIILYKLVGSFGVSNFRSWWGSYLIVGPIEEISKLVALVLIFRFFKDDFNEPNDGIIYMSCVALGFSLIENYQYANIGENNEYLIVLRLLLSTPGHIFFSYLMGISFYLYKREKYSFRIVTISILIAVITHGTYNATIYLGLGFGFIIFLLL